jgi:hypothetical protein
MPLQNRVDPFSMIHRTPARGTCFGNRGILHDDQQRLVAYHRHKAWIICRLAFKGRRRQVMQPGHYTELFFLDEATALAAGHRPCAECNRARFNEFRQKWGVARPALAAQIDEVLHRQRFIPYQSAWSQKKRTHQAPLESLPSGSFISLAGQPYLVWEDTLRAWSFSGYGAPLPRLEGLVTVLTPPATVLTLAQGYRPQVYPESY